LEARRRAVPEEASKDILKAARGGREEKENGGSNGAKLS